MKKHAEIAVVGGAGHVGLPLALVFADRGVRTLLYDVNRPAVERIRRGVLPFKEKGGEALLRKVLKAGRLSFSSDAASLRGTKAVVITIGTPVDEFMNPESRVMLSCIDAILPHLADGQLLILRSTVYPGTTQWLDAYFKAKGRRIRVAFCPERVVQGQAVEELQKLPQIVSGTTPAAEAGAAKLFGRIAPSIVKLEPLEAEFAKLFNNAYRYIQFAVSNQFFMMAQSAGADYGRILRGMKKDYPRSADVPGAGFTAGPCLFKDTMQLAAFSNNHFSLGHSAMIVNEGLVLYVVGRLAKKFALRAMTVGLLGMAFKPNSDDTRASLSYKLKNVLAFRCKKVLTSDPHVTTDPDLLPTEDVVKKSDLLILCVPHDAYRRLNLKGKRVVDVWGFFGKGVGL